MPMLITSSKRSPSLPRTSPLRTASAESQHVLAFTVNFARMRAPARRSAVCSTCRPSVGVGDVAAIHPGNAFAQRQLVGELRQQLQRPGTCPLAREIEREPGAADDAGTATNRIGGEEFSDRWQLPGCVGFQAWPGSCRGGVSRHRLILVQDAAGRLTASDVPDTTPRSSGFPQRADAGLPSQCGQARNIQQLARAFHRACCCRSAACPGNRLRRPPVQPARRWKCPHPSRC